jgi:hypothetical protein
MSEHKHTPGPWVVDKAPSMLGGNGFTVRAGGAIICTAFPGASTDRIEPVAELNARLIAAAPELLEALKAVQTFIEGKPDAVEPFGMVRAAIAKATGGVA